MDHDVDKMMLLNTHYLKIANKAPDLTLYNCTALKKLVNTAKQTITAYNQMQTPVKTPPPPLQALMQNENQQIRHS